MLKWLVYMATEGFGSLKYNVKFKLEISSAIRGETLNSSLDHSSDPPASGRLRLPECPCISLGDRQAKAVPCPSCCLQCGDMQGHTSLPNAAHGYILLKTLLLLKTRTTTIEEQQKQQLVQWKCQSDCYAKLCHSQCLLEFGHGVIPT